MKLVVPEDAEADIASAYAWYEEQRFGLGAEFVASVEATFEFITVQPTLYPIEYRDVRRALLRRFPYAVLFLIEGESVVVLAVTHQARHPERWRERLK